MISKIDERRKWKNVNTEESRKSYRRLRNELKRATDNAEKEYLENIWRTLPPAHSNQFQLFHDSGR